MGWWPRSRCSREGRARRKRLAAEPGAIEGYEWQGVVRDGTASFVYGSPETPEDLEFWLTCEPKTKDTELTVYVDIKGTKIGQAMPIEISVGSAKTTVKGKIATDEMTGFYHARGQGP